MHLKFAVTAFVAMEEHVIRCSYLVKLCLLVTARFILLELFVREVGCNYFFFPQKTPIHNT